MSEIHGCIELGCHAPAGALGYCIFHQAQFWPLWSAHPLDEPCPPGCPTAQRECEEYEREKRWYS